MFCPECGTRARPGQKFCAECGFDLRTIDDAGEATAIEDHDGDADADGDADDESWAGEEGTDALPTIQTADEPVTGDVRNEVSRGLGQPIDPMLARPSGAASPTQDRMWSVTGQQAQVPPAAGAETGWRQDAEATVRMAATAVRPDEAPTRADVPRVEPERTAVYGVPRPLVTAEQPIVPGAERGWDPDAAAAYEPRRQVRLRMVLLPAVIAVAAGALATSRILIEIVPAAAVSGLPAGTWMVNDLGTNNTVAAILAMVAIFGGALLWCFGFRWGAGLAGGGGLALAGWAALVIGLAEWPIADAHRLGAGVGLTITRDVGYWALAVAGGAGILTFLTSLSGAGRDRGGGLDPWIAALGATSVLVAAGGPLIPLGNADVSGNYSSETLATDLPDLFFSGRLVQLGLFGFAGIIGFLLVRRYGLGLAIGGATVAGFQLATAATDQTDSPIGPGYANPGSLGDLTPHGVTVVGMGLAGFFAVVAVVMALLDRGAR